MNKKILIDLIGVLLIALVVVVGYKLSPILLPKADVTVQPDPACDLQREACAVNLPSGGKIELSMGTRPVPMAPNGPDKISDGDLKLAVEAILKS